MFILKVTQQLKKHRVPYAIVGGHAVALHGAIRGTVDIDLITKWSLKNLKNIELALKEINLSPRLPIGYEDLYNFKDEYIKNKNLIAWNFINPSNPIDQVDIIINYDLTNKTTKKIKLSQQEVHILNKKDLIEMKRLSGRAQDISDIKALEMLDEI